MKNLTDFRKTVETACGSVPVNNVAKRSQVGWDEVICNLRSSFGKKCRGDITLFTEVGIYNLSSLITTINNAITLMWLVLSSPNFSITNLKVILLHEKLLQFDWLGAVTFQLNLKYLQVKITNLLRVVV